MLMYLGEQPDDLFLSESMSFSGVLEAGHGGTDSEKDEKASGNKMSLVLMPESSG